VELDPAALTSALKLRATKGEQNYNLLDSAFGTQHSSGSFKDSDSWEAWTLSSSGEFRSRPLVSADALEGEEHVDEQLFVASAGPITKLGKKSVAVGFGNTIKLVTLGKESFDGMASGKDGALDMGVGLYKWRAKRGTGRKVH
jgi:hypothetical protein